jgi:hypothetical protein
MIVLGHSQIHYIEECFSETLLASQKILIFYNAICSWVLVAHAYNPSYSDIRDQEDCSLRPTWTNRKIPSQPIAEHSGAYLSSQLWQKLCETPCGHAGTHLPSQTQQVASLGKKQDPLSKITREEKC